MARQGVSGAQGPPARTSGVSRLPGVAAAILGDISEATFLSRRFSSQLPRGSSCDQQEGGRPLGRSAPSSWSAVPAMVVAAALQPHFPAVFAAKPLLSSPDPSPWNFCLPGLAGACPRNRGHPHLVWGAAGPVLAASPSTCVLPFLRCSPDCTPRLGGGGDRRFPRPCSDPQAHGTHIIPQSASVLGGLQGPLVPPTAEEERPLERKGRGSREEAGVWGDARVSELGALHLNPGPGSEMICRAPSGLAHRRCPAGPLL